MNFIKITDMEYWNRACEFGEANDRMMEESPQGKPIIDFVEFQLTSSIPSGLVQVPLFQHLKFGKMIYLHSFNLRKSTIVVPCSKISTLVKQSLAWIP